MYFRVTLYAEFLPTKQRAKCVVLLDWLPESARYHIASDQTEKALTTLEKIALDNGKPMLLGRLVVDDDSSNPSRRGRIKDLLSPELCRTSLLLWFICRIFLTTMLFIARGIIAGVFQASYVYTPEVYPTQLRSVGVGTCSAMARLGAMVTPYVAQVLIQSSLVLATAVYGVFSLLAAVACLMLPIETKGKEMKESMRQQPM
uniref:Major facilitator superfamily (MFS) profile domain-containing protein n=1 Tax=Timema tahoe TaxID=61484 RepID=A0A7R9IKP2_9NEOP|nr:unnamed protein product [Timema tahoe]